MFLSGKGPEPFHSKWLSILGLPLTFIAAFLLKLKAKLQAGVRRLRLNRRIFRFRTVVGGLVALLLASFILPPLIQNPHSLVVAGSDPGAVACSNAQFVFPHGGNLGWSWSDPRASTKDLDYTTHKLTDKHTGIDIFGSPGDAVYAAYAGVVSPKTTTNFIVITHSALNKDTFYTHIANFKVKVGDQVARGQKIAELDSSGNNHLHFSIKFVGADESHWPNTSDPSPFLQANLNWDTGTRVAEPYTKKVLSYCYSNSQPTPTPTPTKSGSNPTPTPTSTVQPSAPPVDPTNLRATSITADSISLAWDYSAPGNIDGFKLEMLDRGGWPLVNNQTQPPNATSYTVSGLQPNTKYSFRIRAFKGSRDSSNTDLSNVQTLSPPADPTNLRPTNITQTSITLAWERNSTDEDGFKLEVLDRGGWPLVDNQTQPAGTTSYTVNGLQPDTGYSFRVRAFKGSRDSSNVYSNPPEIRTLANVAPTATPAATATTNPAATATVTPNPEPTTTAKPTATTAPTITPPPNPGATATPTPNASPTATAKPPVSPIATPTSRPNRADGLVYYTLPRSIRLLDTRTSPGTIGKFIGDGAIEGNTFRNYPVANLDYLGMRIPAAAKAIEGNVQVATPANGGYLTVYSGPSLANRPVMPSLYFGAKQFLANSITLSLGSDGTINFYSSQTADVLLDISGYYAPPGTPDPNRNNRTDTGLAYYPLTQPIRLLDSRTEAGTQGLVRGGGPHLAEHSRAYQFAGISYNGMTIPANAKALTGNVQVAAPASAGYLTLYPAPADPDGANRPIVASMLYNSNQYLANAVTMTLGDNGMLNIYTSEDTHALVDVTGYFLPYDPNSSSGLLYYPLSNPTRLVDTRAGGAALYSGGGVQAKATYNYRVSGVSFQGATIPTYAKALLSNLEIVSPVGTGFLTAYAGPSDPAGAKRPIAASLLFQSGQFTVNAANLTIGNDGTINIYSFQNAQVLLDVMGYFA